MLEVLHEARLIDRHDRAEAHRHGRELPEARHQPRVRIGREARAAGFLAEAVQPLLREPAFEERARIDAGRGVALDVDQVGAFRMRGAFPEVVEADVVERGRGGERRDVAAELAALAIRLHHHRERIPAHERADAVLEPGLAGHRRLLTHVDRVQVCGGCLVREVCTRAARFVDQALDQVVAAFDPVRTQHRVECIQPLLGFVRIEIASRIRHRSVPSGRKQ